MPFCTDAVCAHAATTEVVVLEVAGLLVEPQQVRQVVVPVHPIEHVGDITIAIRRRRRCIRLWVIRKVENSAGPNNRCIDTVWGAKIDASALAAMRVSSLIICPTLASLFDLQALADTVRLLELADKKARAVVVVNRVLEAKAEATIEQAAAAVGGSGVKVAPVYVCDRPQFAAAIQKGKGVTESHAKTKAADEIRELWAYLDKQEGKLAKTAKEAAE